jgi:uncharacterized protein (TIGR03067 family)
MRNIVAVIVVFIVAPLVRADDKDNVVDKQKKALQGLWLVESAYQDGKEVPKADREKEKYCLYAVKIADDQFQIAFLENKTIFGEGVPFKLDVSPSPKILEWTDGDRKVGVAYAVDGDKLTICYHAGDRGFDKDKVPTKLETKAGDKRYMFVFKRSKEK